MIITIDGPVASGKSTVARKIAENLNIYYLNTGLLNRALAYILLKDFNYQQNDFYNPKIEDLKICLEPDNFIYSYDSKNLESIFWKNNNITQELKKEIMDQYSSILSANKIARDVLLKFQRNFAEKYDVVAEGRDCGSIVFPNARFKFFLTADIKIRAQRWKNYQAIIGNTYSLEDAIQIINERDKRDAERTVAPLIIPEDATIIDNTNLSQQETLNKILSYVLSE